MQTDAELYAITEDNIVFLMRKEKTDEAEDRIRKLEEFIETKEYEKKWYTIPQLNYHHGLIMCLKAENEKNIEQKTSYYKKAIAYLNESINGAKISYPQNMANKLIVMAQNPLAICYSPDGDCSDFRDYNRKPRSLSFCKDSA